MKQATGQLPSAGSGWIAVALLLLSAVIMSAMSASDPTTAEEAGFRLAAESLARDGDLVLSFEDESRMRLEGWTESVRPQMRLVEERILRFGEPWFYPALLVPFVRAAPRMGPVVLNSLLLAIALVAGARSLKRRTGESGAWTMAALVFGSALALYVSATLPVILLVSATTCALALFSSASPSAGKRLHDLYPEDPRGWPLIGRSVVGGFLLGMVAAHHVLYVLLLLGPLILTSRRRWRSVLPAGLAGAAVALALTWSVSGLWPDQGIVPSAGQQVEVNIGAGVTGVERAEIFEPGDEEGIRLSPRLLAWNSLYAMVGSHVGLLPYFAPLLLLLVAWSGSGRSLLLGVAILGLAMGIYLAPFDFAGLPAAVGNKLFIPFYVSLWWLPIRPFEPRTGLIGVLLGLAILWPLWTPPGESPLAGLQAGRSRGPVLSRLPYETSQRDLPVRGEVVTRDLLVRPVGGVEAGGRRGHFRLPLGGRADLLIATSQSLSSLDLRFDAAAGTSLEIRGGEAGDMILTPDGGVAFRVRPQGGRIRHPVWWSREAHTFYRLRFSMPDASGATVFSISSAEVNSANFRVEPTRFDRALN
jgi:hypothetical protein